MVDLTILLPSKNEAESIGKVIDEIRIYFSNSPRILVVDGKSTDGTPDIARSRGVDIFAGEGKGKGSDIRGALKLVDTTYVVMVNSDYTYPMEYLHTVYNLLRRGSYDVVIGCRQFKEKGSMGAANTFGNFSLSLMASFLYFHRISDVCSGMWGFKKGVLDKFVLTSRGFSLEADLFINSVKNRCKILQIPIGYRSRLSGSVAKLGIRDGLGIGWFLVSKRLSW